MIPGTPYARAALLPRQGNPLRGRAARGLDRAKSARVSVLGRDEETAIPTEPRNVVGRVCVALIIGGWRLALIRPTSSERDVEQKFFAELFFKKATACCLFVS